MIVIQVWGLRNGLEQPVLEAFCDSLRNKTAEVLGCRVEDVAVFFPTDHLRQGLGEELVVYIDGVDRHEQAASKLSRGLCQLVKSDFREAKVACFIRGSHAG